MTTKHDDISSEQNHQFEAVRKKFIYSFSWSLGGSLIFECLKVLHTLGLQRQTNMANYGIVGSLFALIYLTGRIADVGTTNTLTPFLLALRSSKDAFKSVFVRSLLFPLLATLTAGAAIGVVAVKLLNPSQSFSPVLLATIAVLMISEALRSFLRQFLHLTFNSRRAIIADQLPFIGYLVVVWGLLLTGTVRFSFELVFVPLMIDSLIATLTFSRLTFLHYRTLPENAQATLPIPSQAALLRTRAYSWFFRLSREAFSSNVLTPLFVVTVGAGQAGLFYAAATVATSLQAIIKTIITFPAAAFLAHLKHQTMQDKQRAFGIIAQRVICVLLIPVGLAILFYGQWHALVADNAATIGTRMAMLLFFVTYFIIVVIDFFTLMYEQFFLIQESLAQLLLFRASEIFVVYLVITNYTAFSPIDFLISVVCVKLCGIALLAFSSYRRWNIRPWGHISKTQLFFFAALLVLASLLGCYVFYR